MDSRSKALSEPNPIPQREPQIVAAGDTLIWTRQINDFPTPDWVLNYVLRSRTDIYKWTATNDAGWFKVNLASAVTALWKPGLYDIGAYVTKSADSEQFEVRTAFRQMKVTQNLAMQPTGADPRSWATRTLPLIEETISKLSSRTVETASVNGQMYTLANLADLFKMRERLKSEIAREEEKARLDAGLGAGNKVAIRFRPLYPGAFPYYPRPPWM